MREMRFLYEKWCRFSFPVWHVALILVLFLMLSMYSVPASSGGEDTSSPEQVTPTPEPQSTVLPAAGTSPSGGETNPASLVIPPNVSSTEVLPPTGAEKAGAPSGQEPLATLMHKGGQLSQVLMQLKKQTGVNVVPRGAKIADLKIDIFAQKEPVSQIMQKIASSNGLIIHQIDAMNYEIMDEKTYQTEVLPREVIRKVFILKYIKAEEARKALQNVLTKNIGQMAADPRTNKLIVTDLPQVVELIKRLLDEIDVQLMTRVFYIRHAEVSDIADKLQNYKSAPGTIDVDPKSHQIIVTDIFQNIKRMEMLVELLDVGPEMRAYDLNNIGFDGKGADQIGKMIEQVLTKNADVFWQIDEKTATLVVQDVPEVQEKIEKILAALDRPVKQVLIYAEMVDTSFDKQYDFGINWKAGTYGDFTTDRGFLNLHDVFIMSGSGLAVDYLNKYASAHLYANLLKKSDTKVLLQPRMLVKNKEEVSIEVGGTKAYYTTNYYSGNTTWQSAGQASVNYGLVVKMKPVISNNGLIEMGIDISNSDANVIDGTGANAGVPLVNTTKVGSKTTLIIPSGETRVLAGIINSMDSKSHTGIPWFAEIPIIGPLFGTYSNKDTQRNILFFITPTIVEEKTRRKDYYRGRSIDELIAEEGKGPGYLETPTTGTLTTSMSGKEVSLNEGAPALSSTRPLELRRLLGENAHLDAETLRQERAGVTGGPSGSFMENIPTRLPSVEPMVRTYPTRGGTITRVPGGERVGEVSPPPPSDEGKTTMEGERVRRLAPQPETQY
jgi:type II secretory pathway component GspD/PulD (secretin)